MNDQLQWNFDDAWVLASLGGSIRQTLGHADHLNHALPTPEEFEISLGRLVGSGLAHRSGGWFLRTPLGDQIVDSLQSTYEQVKQIVPRLNDVPLTMVAVRFDKAVLENAYERYGNPPLRRWWRAHF